MNCLLCVPRIVFAVTTIAAAVAQQPLPPTPGVAPSAPAATAVSQPSESSTTGHRVLLQGKDRLAIVARDGSVEWEMPWGGIHDLHRLANGHVLCQRGAAAVVEIDPESKSVVWSYDSSKRNGNDGRRVEVHSFVPLADGRLWIAESGPARVIEIDRDGTLRAAMPLTVAHGDPHRDTRLVRRLASGNALVCHEGDGCVREYEFPGGRVVFEFAVPLFDRPRADGHGPEAFGNQVFGALRLPNGDTLVATGNGHSVLEVDGKGQIVWRLDQKDLPGIVLAWVTTLEVLANGNYVIGNCHAGPGQPVLVEIEPRSKKLIWRLDAHEQFGNSVSNTLLLDAQSLR